MSDNPMNEAMERAARAAWFDYVDRKGYPNGLPSWDEMASPPLAGTRDDQREEITSNTRAAIAAFLRAAPVSEGMFEAGGKAIHDTDDMCQTIWPDSDDDTGYRGDGAYVRLCKETDLYRNASLNCLTAMSTQLADEIEGMSNGQ